MNTYTSAREHTLADFARVASSLPGVKQPWLAQARQAALARFADIGLPAARDEEWKYTSLAGLEKHRFTASTQHHADDHALATLVRQQALTEDGGHLLVFVHGCHSPALSSPGRLPSGARLASLGETLDQSPESLEPYFGGDDQLTAFAALNTAFMTDGACLHLSRNTVLESPIHLLFIATQAGMAISPHNLIVAEEGAQATVIEHYVAADDAAYFTNAFTRIIAAANASITHYKLQQESLQAFHIAGIHAQQARDSRLFSHSISLGGALTRNDISTTLAAPGGEATLDGLYLVGGRQHVDHHTRVDHRESNCTSRELYRGILDAHARAVFNGKVVVHPGAQKTNAQQANHNLLLSGDAEIDTKPQLEIYADDVKCTHGATIGQLDDNQLFYLRTRGVEETMARSLLVHAFAHDVIERIRVSTLRTRLEKILFTRLPYGDRIRELR